MERVAHHVLKGCRCHRDIRQLSQSTEMSTPFSIRDRALQEAYPATSIIPLRPVKVSPSLRQKSHLPRSAQGHDGPVEPSQHLRSGPFLQQSSSAY